MIHLHVCKTGQHKNKAGLRQTWVYITHVHQHYGQYTTSTCPKCAYKILQIFSRVFEFALAEFARNTRKLMYREYFHFYSSFQNLVQTIEMGNNNFLPILNTKQICLNENALNLLYNRQIDIIQLYTSIALLSLKTDMHMHKYAAISIHWGEYSIHWWIGHSPPPKKKGGGAKRNKRLLANLHQWRHIILLSINKDLLTFTIVLQHIQISNHMPTFIKDIIWISLYITIYLHVHSSHCTLKWW